MVAIIAIIAIIALVVIANLAWAIVAASLDD